MNEQPVKWADRAMYPADPHSAYSEETGVMPRVTLLWMNEDPLGSIAAMTSMYQGRVVRSLSELTKQDRIDAWHDATATHLSAPLEAVKFQFMIDGVSRSFTHQMVRQRTANYAQESMRFAVIDNLKQNSVVPPTMWGGDPTAVKRREIYDRTLDQISAAYDELIGLGTPAEDARELLPHGTATRIFYDTNLRNLLDHAGNRLCTQAQFHWRMVFNQIVHQIRIYGNRGGAFPWQFPMIAESPVFSPVCYRLNKCPFNASFDRACKIKNRVEQLSAEGIPSAVWDDTEIVGAKAIQQVEWLMDPTAARLPS